MATRKFLFFNVPVKIYWSVVLITIYLTLLITDKITDNITNNVIDKFESGCYTTFANQPVNLERCIQKSNEARNIGILNKEMCASCGSGGLCLKDADLQYCESQFDANSSFVRLRAMIKSVTEPIMQYNPLMVIIILALIGWALVVD